VGRAGESSRFDPRALHQGRQESRACAFQPERLPLFTDLLNVTTLRDRAWPARYVAMPDRVLAAGDPIAKEFFA
jgi:hypothetical protein